MNSALRRFVTSDGRGILLKSDFPLVDDVPLNRERRHTFSRGTCVGYESQRLCSERGEKRAVVL